MELLVTGKRREVRVSRPREGKLEGLLRYYRIRCLHVVSQRCLLNGIRPSCIRAPLQRVDVSLYISLGRHRVVMVA
jgi:hypothetical protein